jgi:phosphoserine phosphatase
MKCEKEHRIKLVFFDADGVLFDTAGYRENNRKIALSTWNVVFQELGIYPEHERLKEMYLKGIFPTYMEWTDEACKVLQQNGLTRDKFLQIINSRPLMNGAIETFKELRNRGYKTATITGSFEALALRAKELLNLDYAVGHCRLNFDESGKLKSWDLVPCDFEGKCVYFRKIADEEGVSYSECAYVGDEVNDIPIFREVGLSIAFNTTKEEVRKAAHVTIDKKDLKEILKYFPKIK